MKRFVLCLLLVGCQTGAPPVPTAEAIPDQNPKLKITNLRNTLGDTWRLVELTHNGKCYTMIQNYDQHTMGMCLLETTWANQ